MSSMCLRLLLPSIRPLHSHHLKRYSRLAVTAGIGGAAGGMLRSFVECPVEVLKTRSQVNRPFSFSSSVFASGLYTGMLATTFRNTSVISLFWMLVASSKDTRHGTLGLAGTYTDAFVVGAGCSALSWTAIFPLDVIKSRIQSNGAFTAIAKPGPTSGSSREFITIRAAVGDIMAVHGLAGFYRGFGAGLLRSTVANGFAFIIYDYTRKQMLA